MKTFRIALLLLCIGVFFYPDSYTVTIDKNEKMSIKPFAGSINGVTVGTDICCKYWLEKGKQPDVAHYRITKPLVLGALGYIYSATPIKV